MKTLVVTGIVLAFFPCSLTHAAPGQPYDPPFGSLSGRQIDAPAPLFSLMGLDLAAPRPAPLIPGSPLFYVMQATQAAKRFVVRGYADSSLSVRSFSYSSPEQLVNWAAPQVTLLKRLDFREYHGHAWQVHFAAPRCPGSSAHMVVLPGDDFDVLVTQDGRALCVTEACD